MPAAARAGHPVPVRTVVTAVAVVALVQFALQSWFFPLGELLSATPLHHVDSAYHQYQMEVARALCALGGVSGYDPFFAAGYLGGASFNASAKVPALLACLAGSADAIAPIYKGFSFWLGVTAPAAFAAGALALLAPRPALLAAALGVLLWWTGPLRWYHTAGLVSWVAAAYFAVPYAAALSSACQAPRRVAVAGAAVGAAAGMLLHPLFPVAVAVLAAPLVLVRLNSARAALNAAGVLVVVGLTALAANLWWITATLRAPGLATTQVYQRAVEPLLVLREPLGIASTASGGSRLYIALAIGAALAIAAVRGVQRREIAAIVVAWALAMAWASFGGTVSAIAALQPNRLSTFAWLALALPASAGAVAALEHARRSSALRKITWALPLAAFAGLFVYFVREAGVEVFGSGSARYAVERPEVKGVGRSNAALLAWIREHTDASARVFFETSLARVHDGTHVAGWLAAHSGREFVGGPYPFTDAVGAWDGIAFGERLEDMSADRLGTHLDRYNVRWMLCHSAACSRAMARLPDAKTSTRIGPVTLFERSSSPGFFVSGRGSIESRAIDRVVVRAQPGADIVLRYHWVPGLTASPPARVEPVTVDQDARPFVRVVAPPARFSLSVIPVRR